ncbi:MAG: gluconate 2-dehydrogenase subunit 3 family protein [Trueperaceae bacterium]|nr:gluconate 2-dehydrogenase subunit 3 family protein [Trueperaceae bacterium]
MKERAEKTSPSLSRRRFLQVASALGLAHLLTGSEQAQNTPNLPQNPQFKAPGQTRHLPRVQAAYTFFTLPEARFVEAAVSRLIPADDLGPGALETGVAYFIDQQLQGKFGLAATWYMQGPWQQGTPEQGYQHPFNPQELYRLCIPAIDMHAEESKGQVFADLSVSAQDDLLAALEGEKLEISPLPQFFLSTFWQILYDNTMQGFFADPVYGGNDQKAGWRLVGFPGVAAAYRGVMEAYYGRPYQVEPVSLADLQAGAALADESGHAIHRDLATGEILSVHPESFKHEH